MPAPGSRTPVRRAARKTAPPPRRTPPRPKGAGARGALGLSAEMILPAYEPGLRPKSQRPAMAVLGRSNVGKSSLLNALLGIKVARVSQTPGRTQALYWYRVDGTFDLVDCPGYGYAKTSREARSHFSGLIEELLTGAARPSLALLLVDSRLAPQEADRSMALFLENAGVPAVVAATKWDGVKPSERVRRLRELAAAYENPHRALLPVSAETGENIHALSRLLRDRLTKPARGGPVHGAPPGHTQEES